jgi:hypothetical protein
MLLLNVLIHHDGGLLGPALKCCDVTSTSNHTLAVSASSHPSKNSGTASSVSANALLHVWLMNHVASPTCCAASPCANSRSITLPWLHHVNGRTYSWQNCDVDMRPSDQPTVDRSHDRYRTATPCNQTRHSSCKQMRLCSSPAY